jgi:hypothetical protein
VPVAVLSLPAPATDVEEPIVAKSDDNLPDFSDLDLPEDEGLEESPFALPEVTDEGVEAPADAFAVDAAAEAAVAEEPVQQPSVADREAAEAKEGFLQKLEKISPYTVMLVLSFVAVAIGALLMFIELKGYDFEFRTQDVRSALQR